MGELNTENKLSFVYILLILSHNITITGMAGELPDDLRLAQFFKEMDEEGAEDVMEVEDDSAVPGIQARLISYLEKKKAEAAANNSADGPQTGSSVYNAIKRFNLSKLEVPSLNGGAISTSVGTGAFYGEKISNCGPAKRHIFNKKRNLSFSFDPTTMACLSCPDRHNILEGGGGLTAIAWSFFWQTIASLPLCQLTVGCVQL
jgi:hypothetical protein